MVMNQQSERSSSSRRRSALGRTERIASAGAGSALLALTARRMPSWRRVSMLLGGGYLVYRGISGRCLVSEALGLRRPSDVHAGTTITIERPVHEVYSFWRELENLPRFMKHIESVRTKANGQTHWVAEGPAGIKVDWDAEITEDRPDEAIAWRSVTGSELENEGRVDFLPMDEGRATEVRVLMSYDPKAGSLGAAMALLMGNEPELMIKEDLRRFKQVMETGDVVTTEGQPAGRHRSRKVPGAEVSS